MSQSANDTIFMSRAIQLAKKGRYTTHPNPRVGCVITKNDKVIAEGFHQKAGEPHAEINALNSLKGEHSKDAEKATAYVTLEPCSHTGRTPPCANALIDAGISRVVIAMQDPNPQVAGKGIQKLKEAGLDVSLLDVLEDKARALNVGFIKRMEIGLPWVRLKLAMSLDGRTAMSSGESKWITGAEARRDVQVLRATADVILTGIGTVLADDPSLNVRTSAEELSIAPELFEKVKQPTRVILDSGLRLSPKAKLLSLSGDVLVYTLSSDTTKIKRLEAVGATVITIESGVNNKLSLPTVLKDLADKQFNEIHIEAGATLCGAFMKESLVDELIVYMAPTIMGSNTKGLFNIAGLDKMKDKIDVSIKDIRAVGKDWRFKIACFNKGKAHPPSF